MNFKSPRLISSVHGRINHILVVLPDKKVSNNCYWELLKRLLVVLPGYTKFAIWAYPEKEVLKELESLLTQLNLEYFYYANQGNGVDLFFEKKCCILIPQKIRNFSTWVQDFFLIVNDSSSNSGKQPYYLVEPYNKFFRTDEDHIIADELAGIDVFESYDIPLVFHGGNILCGDDFILYGAHHFQHTWQILTNTEKSYTILSNQYFNKEVIVKNIIANYLGGDKKVLVVGERLKDEYQKLITNCQAFVHLDMYISLAGRNKQGDYIIIVADPIAVNKKDEVIVQSLKPRFDETSEQLRKNGFVILRNPVPLTRSRLTKGEPYYCLYNNCIVEITDDRKRVWMPKFGIHDWEKQLKEYDFQNRDIWRGLDFEVEELIDGHSFAIRSGGVHCLVKCLSRGG